MADILIRGMEMPHNCFNCSTKIDPDNRRCNIDGHVFVETLSKLTCRRDEHCPLVELLPHGDLIDRDKIKFTCAGITPEDLDYARRYVIDRMPVIVQAEREETND